MSKPLEAGRFGQAKHMTQNVGFLFFFTLEVKTKLSCQEEAQRGEG